VRGSYPCPVTLLPAARCPPATADRPAQLGCFGLHEWVMVYRSGPDDVRHGAWPLHLEQPGCLHATMDLYMSRARTTAAA
jgi:hypothetical protein